MKVAEYSEVLNIPNDFLESDFPERCINTIPYLERTENEEWYGVFIYIYGKEGLQPQSKHYIHGQQERLEWHWLRNYLNKIKPDRQYLL